MNRNKSLLSRRAFIKWWAATWALATPWSTGLAADVPTTRTESDAYGSGAYGQGLYPGEQHQLYLPNIKKGDN